MKVIALLLMLLGGIVISGTIIDFLGAVNSKGGDNAKVSILW